MIATDDPADDRRAVNAWVELVQPHVDYCPTCQAYDGGELIWVLGEQHSMEDFLSGFDVPEELWEDVASQLCCNGCGVGLDMTCDVGTKSAADIEDEQRSAKYWTAWKTEYEPKLRDFTKFLSLYPYLGCDHEFEQHILDEVSKFPSISIDDESWCRARKPDGARTFLSADLYPPKTPSSEGRYSHYGQQVFYLASTAESAALEVLGEDESLAWVQEYRLRKLTRILDLAAYVDERDRRVSVLEFGLDHTDAHRKPADPASPWKPQYFFPRFIADCARRKGYRGIRFRSHKHISCNLVLFKWAKSTVQPRGKPKIVTLKEKARRKASEEPF
jgi:hypothetical protein